MGWDGTDRTESYDEQSRKPRARAKSQGPTQRTLALRLDGIRALHAQASGIDKRVDDDDAPKFGHKFRRFV